MTLLKINASTETRMQSIVRCPDMIERALHTHPGFDSAIDLARQSGDVIVGHSSEHTGCDIFGRSPLCIFDGDENLMYTFGWRWSESGHRNVLGWWYGDSEWDVANIQSYGPVLSDT